MNNSVKFGSANSNNRVNYGKGVNLSRSVGFGKISNISWSPSTNLTGRR